MWYQQHDIMISSPPLKSLPSRLIWLSTGLSTKWATKVVYDACKIQIGQPCLPAILLNTLLLDSALIHFSCPDSSPLSKHLIGTLVILSSWSISQKCKIRICATARGNSSLFLFSFLYHPFICRRLLGSQMLWLRGSSLYRPSKSSGPFPFLPKKIN